MVVADHFTYWDRRSLRSLFTWLELVVVRNETFGLGRDFVRWVDRVSPSSARVVRGRGDDANADGWDTTAAVDLLEGAMNAGFRRLGGGVGVELLLRASGGQ